MIILPQMHSSIRHIHIFINDYWLLFDVQTELNDLLRPISEQIQEVQSFREKNRGSSLFNHLSAVSESIPALGWVAVVSISVSLYERHLLNSVTSWVSLQNPWTEAETYLCDLTGKHLVWFMHLICFESLRVMVLHSELVTACALSCDHQ